MLDLEFYNVWFVYFFSAFDLLSAVDGVFREQYFEIWAVLFSTLLIVGYIVLNFVSGHNGSDIIKVMANYLAYLNNKVLYKTPLS